MSNALIFQKRIIATPEVTISKNEIWKPKQGIVFEYFSLELPWRNNEPQTSCIPDGLYDMVLLENSPSFPYPHYHILDVEGREWIKNHAANYVRQLRGCIAPGSELRYLDADGMIDVSNSRATLEKVIEHCGGNLQTLITWETRLPTL